MSELVSKDTDGTEHFHWIQEREQSCGPACVFMIERIKRLACTVGGEARIRDIASRFPKGYDENNGTHFEALKKALDQIGLSATAGRVNNMKTFAEAGNFPFIARVGWTQGGGHFVVGQAVAGHGALEKLDGHGLHRALVVPLGCMDDAGRAFPHGVRQAQAGPGNVGAGRAGGGGRLGVERVARAGQPGQARQGQ